MGRNSLFYISKCSRDLILSYVKVYAIVCTKMDFKKLFAMSLDFADAKNSQRRGQGNGIHHALSHSTAII